MYFPAGPGSVTLQSLSSDTCSEDDEYLKYVLPSVLLITVLKSPITNDEALEDDHEFNVTITGAGSSPHASLGTPTITTVIIKDDESEYLSMINIIFCDVM